MRILLSKVLKLFSFGTSYRPSGIDLGMNVNGNPMVGTVDIAGRNFGVGNDLWRC